MSCIQRSSCTPAKCQAWTAIVLGVGIASFIPLLIGCLGKYHVIALGRPLSQGMIVSGSLGTACFALAALSGVIVSAIFRYNNIEVDLNRF